MNKIIKYFIIGFLFFLVGYIFNYIGTVGYHIPMLIDFNNFNNMGNLRYFMGDIFYIGRFDLAFSLGDFFLIFSPLISIFLIVRYYVKQKN